MSVKQSLKISTAGAVAVLLLGSITTFAADASAATTRYEAESAPAVCDGTIDSNHSGFSGSGFCNGANAVDSSAQFTVTPEAAGTATLGIRFANGTTSARPVDLVVNGTTAQSVSFEPTGAWSSWSTKSVTVPLNSGGNTVRLEPTTTAGLPNIDYLDVTDGGDPPLGDGRKMESLGRGVVAVRSGSDSVLVSWRLLGLDPEGIGFNVYRSTAGGQETKLNSSVLTGGTNYVDSTANLSQANTYRVRPVIDGVEQPASGAFTLSANHATEPVVRVPLRSGGPVKFVWVGDLDGDGEYDYVLDRQTSPQTIEAYRSNGEFLWSVNMGPNSTDQNNIEGGSSTIDVGHNDGVTVYDFDSDGRAEVAVRIANGVRFGDGTTYDDLPNNTRQAIAILDGMTGAARATAPVPTDYLSDGPMYARFGVGHLDGENPSLVAYMKNRIGNGGFNLMFTAWRFSGSTLTQEWKFLRGNQNLPDGHNTRVIDVDGDGRDEVAEIGFVLNGDGTLKYSLGPQGVVHGDRFHIADMDPNRPGLEGYAVQQDNPSGLREYYYAAATGTMIWRHTASGTADVGRGMAGDIDPRHPGMEVWSFSGLYNAPTNRLAEPNTSLQPWPQTGLWWDGDITMELLNDGKFEKWDPNDPRPTNSLPRLLSTWNYGAVDASQNVQPTFHGDILGDWREEVVYTNASYDELIIFTTDRPSSTRLYTLAHNPAYRNDMTVKGYMQSHHVDYFLGAGMARPPQPDITYSGR
ncbi:carbohydrate-binding protein [Myceligenerans pegani]|uniref:Carbohydrate-binding protein n=1 Tax=Myceligenerans pegani TaxID=2776917 RepID=A0ABR9N3A7_9MICO|nr:carbohydrate-binding protein [Myceligenerans sp. TRM 65318]MBE1877614.1 carbohydrate-binding protein [Myceligenerans sp. TRM 65318]MBE3019885.1 carbohydrate-binding protein [Myceligenerans sp. TRM 65318]